MKTKKDVIKECIETEIAGKSFNYEITCDNPSEYHSFVESESYIFECTYKERPSYSPYHSLMLGLASIETGSIEYWYDDEFMPLEEVLLNIRKMLNFLTS
ncbi:hypothetical protein ABID29_002428 [Streptococcus rupicaprae]|uniref:Phage protein n=1 Tax=Streptococcus rupicaprae TaxID=759619 RepID=A0ABV2FL76_9STRE